MKQFLYIIILLLNFSCKKEKNNSVELNSDKQESIAIKDTVKLDNNRGSNPIYKSVELAKNDKDSIFKWIAPKEFSKLDRRTVKAKSGLLIRDSLGNKIGKLDFGEVIYILNYSKDSTTIVDNSNVIKGRTAKIVTKWSYESIKVSDNKYKHNWYVLKDNIGFIFDGFLYENSQNTNDNTIYKYGYLVLGEKGEDSKIDLQKVLEIKKIDFEKYKNQILDKQKITPIEAPKKIDGTITLSFENGEHLILKDTTYHSEYNPTKSFNVFHHRDFPNSYMVSENMFFMPNTHTEISIKNGDTLNTFNGYPYVSPNKKYVILVTHDLTECYHDTYFEVHKKSIDNSYTRLISFTPESWSYPFKKNNSAGMDDIFSLYWLDDDEFIINVVNYVGECYNPEKLSKPYFLKFKIKI
ncbi:hypothetical protein [Olleya sp. YS]|uniref:hypothetical protein n=1 Tax=Olleya sp. YS TaxID=3028318 RepID=UPI0024343F15|nr:hypothetical protein [Olleya sp. YS]WGD34805.1 hypothetical protein Ollyesu_13565 [Olleya sp. YS]